MKRAGFLLGSGLAVAALLVFLAGCEGPMWWDYRDDPYLAEMAKDGPNEVLRHVNSPIQEERQMALRIMADAAGDARRRGSEVEADRLDSLIIGRYAVEKETVVRACIVRICAPLVGPGSRRMPEFLLARIAAGEFPGYAAQSLALLAPRNAFLDIEPLTRHPDHSVRYQAAVALTILADPQGYAPVLRVWRGMESEHWPQEVDGEPLAQARNGLALRARRSFGQPFPMHN